MEAQHQRPIRDGSQYDGLFPRAEGRNQTVKADASLADTLKLIPGVVRSHGWQAAKIARALAGPDVRSTCRNTWEFCYHHIQYHKDEEGSEQIRSPARAWSDRVAGIDCDCYTTLVSSILSNLSIPHKLRIAKYPNPDDPDPDFQHIYVIVPQAQGHITIDPVTDRFDYEVPFLETKDIDMKLQFLNGPPGTGLDNDDLFPATAMGATTAPIPGTVKGDRIIAEAAAKGMTVPQYQEWVRQEFIKKNGVTPEQWAANIEAQMAQQQQASNAAYNADTEKVKAELKKRGVGFPANATRDQLLELLRQNPAPKPGGQAIHAVNVANPATVLLRTGVLLGMKINLMGVAAKLRWALASQADAVKAGMSAADHAKTKEIWERLRKIHYGAGGKPEHLMEAVLTGKGNRDKAVSLGGFPLAGNHNGNSIGEILGQRMCHAERLAGHGGVLAGLGEPVTATAAIGAATAALTAIAMLLKAVKTPKGDEGGEVPTDPNMMVDEAGNPVGQSSGGVTTTLLPTGGEAGKADPNGGGGGGADDDKPKTGILEWMKSNPLPSAGIGIALLGGGYLVVKALTGGPKKPKKGANLDGTPAKGAKGRKKRKGKQEVKVVKIK